MNDCNYFIPVVDETYAERVAEPNGVGPLVAEWNHARKFFSTRLAFIGIWRSGSTLPEPLGEQNTIDVRVDVDGDASLGAPWAQSIAEMFPAAAPGNRGPSGPFGSGAFNCVS